MAKVVLEEIGNRSSDEFRVSVGGVPSAEIGVWNVRKNKHYKIIWQELVDQRQSMRFPIDVVRRDHHPGEKAYLHALEYASKQIQNGDDFKDNTGLGKVMKQRPAYRKIMKGKL